MFSEIPTRNTIQYKVLKFASEEEQIDILIANAPFLSRTLLSDLLGISLILLEAVAKHLSITLLEPFDDGYAPQIAERLGYVPVDAIVKPWVGGTKVICSTDVTGYLGIIHHFSENTLNSKD